MEDFPNAIAFSRVKFGSMSIFSIKDLSIRPITTISLIMDHFMENYGKFTVTGSLFSTGL